MVLEKPHYFSCLYVDFSCFSQQIRNADKPITGAFGYHLANPESLFLFHSNSFETFIKITHGLTAYC
jgi:hypothetical protein